MHIARDPLVFNGSPQSSFTVQQDITLYMNSISIDLKVDGAVWLLVLSFCRDGPKKLTGSIGRVNYRLECSLRAYFCKNAVICTRLNRPHTFAKCIGRVCCFNHDDVSQVTELHLSTKFHICQCCSKIRESKRFPGNVYVMTSRPHPLISRAAHATMRPAGSPIDRRVPRGALPAPALVSLAYPPCPHSHAAISFFY